MPRSFAGETPALPGDHMLKKIDHLGIAVRSLDESVPYYEKALGLKCEHREEVPSQKVRTAFFTVGDVHPRIAGTHRSGKSHCEIPRKES
jgi:catechol 2,3-dioxygenase-like lactoylglutathione lyase family enzyme